MNSYEANLVSVVSVSAPYEVRPPHADNRQHQKIMVNYHGNHEGLTKELTVSSMVFPLEKIEIGGSYMAICNKSGYAEFFLDTATFHRREAFVGEFFPAIKHAIFELDWALSTCQAENDRKLIRSTMDSLFYTLVALGRESDLPSDESFFDDRDLPF